MKNSSKVIIIIWLLIMFQTTILGAYSIYYDDMTMYSLIFVPTFIIFIIVLFVFAIIEDKHEDL